jgi:hypothetical protein
VLRGEAREEVPLHQALHSPFTPVLLPPLFPTSSLPSLPFFSPSSQVLADAHETPIQCLEYCPERDELATCAFGNKVKVWDISRPTVAIRHKHDLDHAEGEAGDEDGSGNYKARGNMNWLTRSDMAGLPRANMSPMVEECINNAMRDTPEVTQVRGELPGGMIGVEVEE